MSADEFAKLLIIKEAELDKVKKELFSVKNQLTQYEIKVKVLTREKNQLNQEIEELTNKLNDEEKDKIIEENARLSLELSQLTQHYEQREQEFIQQHSPLTDVRIDVLPSPQIPKGFRQRNHFESENNDDDCPNGWTQSYSDTVGLWKESCTEMSFVYQHIRDKMLTTISIITLVLLGISIVRETIDVSHLALNENQHAILIWCIKSANVVLSTIALFMTGYLKVFGITDHAEALKNFITKVDSFLSLLMSETTLPKQLRKNAEEFIIQHKNTYYSIIQDQPKDLQTLYEEAYEKYKLTMRGDDQQKSLTKTDKLLKHGTLNA
jgi:hypothetical protein